MSTKNSEEQVQRIVKRIVSDYSPLKIILFGSYAYGAPDRDSDIDLLIIKGTGEGFLDRLTTVRKLASGVHRGIPFDPLVLTPEEVEARLQAGDQFIEEILEKGHLVYGA